MNAQCNAINVESYTEDTRTDSRPGLLKRIGKYVLRRRQERVDRAAFNNLLSLDDGLLKDIGVSRGDVRWASNLPLSVNAAIELEIVAKRARREHRHQR